MDLTMKFDSDFFKEEIRCGFKVGEKQKKVWACEIDLANKLLEVCKKHNIKLMAMSGTLLGAIRHKGFIPWDDDFDFAMLRPDFERLIRIAANEFEEPYFLQTMLSDRAYFLGYARLRNSSTTGVIKGHTKDYNCGIFIDIYVLDGFVYDDKLFNKQMQERRIAEARIKLFQPLSPTSSVLKGIVKRIACPFVKITNTYEGAVQKYWRVLSKNTDKTDRVSLMTHLAKFARQYWVYKEDFDTLIYVDFENIKIPISANYDRILSNIYGDYMKFPPAEERGEWHNGIIYFDPDISYRKYFEENER